LYAPKSPCFGICLIYDEFDLTAMALRGLNAERGRQAGLAENPFDSDEEPFEQQLNTRTELNDRYFLEYPHAALLIFRAGYWLQPHWRDVAVPPAILDADYHNLATFEPCTEEELRVWHLFVRASDVYTAIMVICLLALIAVLCSGYGPQSGVQGGAAWLLLPAALFFTLNRFDIVPALLTAISLACLGRRWLGASALFLALAVLVKVYPVLFVPLIIRYLWPQRRALLRFNAVFGVTCLLALTPLFFGQDLQSVLGPYRFQLTRPPEHLTIYGCLLPEIAAEGWFGSLFRLGSLACVMAVMVWLPIPNMASLLRRAVLVLLVFVTLAVFYSPQWVLWFAPILFPLLPQSRRLGWSWVALDLITYLTFPVWFWVLPHMGLQSVDSETADFLLHFLGTFLRVARFLVCGAIALQIVIAEWPWLIRKSLLGRWLPRVAAFLARKE